MIYRLISGIFIPAFSVLPMSLSRAAGGIVIANFGVLIVVHDASLGADPTRLEVWRARFHEHKQSAMADSDSWSDWMIRLSVLEGSTLLDELDDVVAFSKEWAHDQRWTWEEGLRNIADYHSKVDRLDMALEVAGQIETKSRRQMAIRLVAVRQAQRGDIADAMKVANELESNHRDQVIDYVIREHVEQQELDKAREKLQLVQGDELRKQLRRQLDRESQRPSLDDPAYVEKQVAWTMRAYRKQLKDTKTLRDILNDGPEPSPKDLVPLARHIAVARLAHHSGDHKTCLKELQAAYRAAQAFEDADRRMFEVLCLACISHQLDEKRFARQILVDATKDAESDDYYMAAKLHGLDVMNVVLDVFTDAEMEPLIARWKTDEFLWEFLFLVYTLAERREFDRLDRLYQKSRKLPIRLFICCAAISELTQRPLE